jgi:hypothetical protein
MSTVSAKNWSSSYQIFIGRGHRHRICRLTARGTLAVFAVLYVVIYSLTAQTYYKLV